MEPKSRLGGPIHPLFARVRGIVDAALYNINVDFYVYPDDRLIIGSRRPTRKGVRQAVHRFRKVGFLISEKSILEPCQVIEIVAKILDFSNVDAYEQAGTDGGQYCLGAKIFCSACFPLLCC